MIDIVDVSQQYDEAKSASGGKFPVPADCSYLLLEASDLSALTTLQ